MEYEHLQLFKPLQLHLASGWNPSGLRAWIRWLSCRLSERARRTIGPLVKLEVEDSGTGNFAGIGPAAVDLSITGDDGPISLVPSYTSLHQQFDPAALLRV